MHQYPEYTRWTNHFHLPAISDTISCKEQYNRNEVLNRNEVQEHNRNEVIPLNHQEIYSTEQFWDQNCYFTKQLTNLAMTAYPPTHGRIFLVCPKFTNSYALLSEFQLMMGHVNNSLSLVYCAEAETLYLCAGGGGVVMRRPLQASYRSMMEE